MTSPVPALQSLKTRITLTTLAIFLVSLWSLSFIASQMLHKDMERLLGEQQFSRVSFLADEIERELNNRFEALQTVAEAVNPVILGDALAMQTILEQRPLLRRLFNAGVIAYRLDGTAIADSLLSATRRGVNYLDIDTIAAALKEGKSTVGRPVMGKKLLAPVFGLTVPLRDAQGQVIGALSGVTSLAQPSFMDLITARDHGKTGGYMLVAPQYRLVVTATDKSRIMENLPGPGRNPMLDRFVQGYEGTAVMVNPLGVEVLASAKAVPVAGWYVAAALPTAEIFAPAHEMQQRMLLATVWLTLLAGVLTWWMLRRQLAPMLSAATTLATMSDANHPLQPLPITRNDEIGQLIGGFNRLLKTLAQREEALTQSERKHSEILENVDAYIYLKDMQGRYLFANRTMREFFGVTMDEIVGQSDERFFDSDTVAQLRTNDRMVLEKGKPINTDENDLRLLAGCTSTHLSHKLPLRNEAGEIYALCGISTDITKRKRDEEELRIAAIAFECQEGIVVMDADLKILRVNRVFTQTTGYTQHEVRGQTTAILRSDRHPASFYDAIWNETKRTGGWQGEMWHQRKNGEHYPERVTITVVRDAKDQVTHYIGNLIDATNSQLQEQQRLIDEAAHRDTLVREVHHRIKNNLQGITSLLRQFAQKHPATAAPINQAIGQIRGISVIHGLQGRAATSSVRLCELTAAIADEIQSLWQTPVVLDIPALWVPCVIEEKEAVPIALVLNELILNAIKHGGQAQGKVGITLRKGCTPDRVQINITNAGQLATRGGQTGAPHSGLQLISALMPRSGASLGSTQHGDLIMTLLELQPPVIYLDQKEPT